MTRHPDKSGEALSDLLEDERAALLSGDLDRLETLLPQKIELVERLNAGSDDDPSLLADLQSRIVRNQSLLQGAMDGIRSVSEHVNAARAVRATLTVYDGSGRTTQHHSKAPSKLERRA